VDTAGEQLGSAKDSRRGSEYLGGDRNRRGERRRGRLNPGLEERFGSRSKASKSIGPEMAAAQSWVPSGVQRQAVSRRAETARGHGLARSQPRLRIGRNPWTERTL